MRAGFTRTSSNDIQKHQNCEVYSKMKAIVNTAVCRMFGQPTDQCTVEDEALYGMIVDIQ